jgi:hypothetical protein
MIAKRSVNRRPSLKTSTPASLDRIHAGITEDLVTNQMFSASRRLRPLEE